MSFNVGGIYVESKGNVSITTQQVADAITAYWIGKGAKSSDLDPRKIPTLSVEKTKKLGLAVLSAGSQIAIADSERYTADYALAEHLSKALNVPVFWYALYGATDGGSSAWFGASKKKKAPQGYGEVEEYVERTFEPAFIYLGELGKTTKRDRFVSFTNVKDYDSGPEDDEEEEEEDEAPPKTKAKKKKASKNEEGGGWTVDPKKRASFKARVGPKKNSARDNLTIVFHCNALGDAAKKVFDAYRAAIPKGVLRWSLVGSSSTTVRQIKDPAGMIGRCNGQLAKKDGFFFVASDDDPEKPSKEEPDIPAYVFLGRGYQGRSDSAALEMRFPSDLLFQVGAEKVVELATFAASTLDYFSGYAGLTLCPFPLINMYRHGFAVYEELKKHPGYDAFTSEEAIRTKLRGGARWLNFVGPALAKKQKMDSSKLAKSGVTITELDKKKKGVLLRSSVEPSPDPDAKMTKALRAIAKALEPVSLFGDRFLEFDTEEEKERLDWERRFLK